MSILENNIHAGTKYLRHLMDTYFNDPELAEIERMYFTMAAYNAGPEAVADLEKLIDSSVSWTGNIWRFTFYDCQRKTIYEQDNVGNDVLVRPFYLELVGAEIFIVIWVLKINDLDRLPLLAFTQVLFNRLVTDQGFPNGLISLHQGSNFHMTQFTGDFPEVFFTDPGIDPLDCIGQSGFKHNLTVELAFFGRFRG